MGIYNNLINKQANIAVVGLGYVGMPIAIEYAKRGINVIGFDLNSDKINLYKSGIDPTKEVGDLAVKNSSVFFTNDAKELSKASFYIVAVPTPVNLDKTPDLNPVISASKIIGKNLAKNSIVVYESTVYPGVTEDICAPILEECSGLVCGKDFYIGYSPERINPGDTVHRLTNIKKIVSGMNPDVLEEIAKIYEIVIDVGVHRAPSIKVAEAAKVVENSQRDINIAFMNELAMAFDKMCIDTQDVLDAMNTKWNALGFKPGLVGGHCIGVDPYYFIYEAEKLGYHSQIILSGRKINDGMAEFIAETTIKKLFLANKTPKNCKVAIFGVTFKENCPDVRNSKVADIISYLKKYGITPAIVDPQADASDLKRLYDYNIVDIKDVCNLDCIILAVAHKEFLDMANNFDKFFNADLDNSEKLIIDVKSCLNKQKMIADGYNYWRL